MTALLSRVFIGWDGNTVLCEGMVLPNGRVVAYWHKLQMVMVMDSMPLFLTGFKDYSDHTYIEWVEWIDYD